MRARLRLLSWFAAACATRAAAAGPCLALRPTAVDAAWSYDGAEAASFDTPAGNVRVWYARGGRHAPPGAASVEVPEAAWDAGAAAEAALARYDELGFRRPLSDAQSPCPDNGGNARLDVYLFDFNAADGTAVTESCSDDATPSCAGFAIVENDFATGAYSSPLEGFRTVVPHELFHLVQQAYTPVSEAWWMEGTAQWAAKRVFPELRDLERFLPAFFRNPERALDFPALGAAAGSSYGAAIWPVFLAERFDEALPRLIFEELADGAPSVLAATEPVLRERGADLASSFAEFARWNAATGARAGDSGYARASEYPLVELEPGASALTPVSGKLAGLSARYFEAPGGARRELGVSGSTSRVDAWFLPLSNGVARLADASRLPYTGTEPGIVIVSGKAVDRRDSSFTLHASPSPSIVDADGGEAGEPGSAPSAGAGGEPSSSSGGAGSSSGGAGSFAGEAPEHPSAAGAPGASDQGPSAPRDSAGCLASARSPSMPAGWLGALASLSLAALVRKRAARPHRAPWSRS